MVNHDRVQLQFGWGRHKGLVVEAPAALVEQLPSMRFTVTDDDRVFDLDGLTVLREVRVLVNPRTTPAPAAAEPEPEAAPPSLSEEPPRRRPAATVPLFLAPGATLPG